MRITALIASMAVFATTEAAVISKHHSHRAAPAKKAHKGAAPAKKAHKGSAQPNKKIQEFINKDKKENSRLGRLNNAKVACKKIKDGHKRFLCKQRAYDKAIKERDASLVQWIDYSVNSDEDLPSTQSLVQ